MMPSRTPLRPSLFLLSLLTLGPAAPLAGCDLPPPISQMTPLPEAEGTPGTYGLVMTHDETSREAIVYVPSSYDAGAGAGLMLNFHGYGGTAPDQLVWADMRDLAERDGHIVVYPQGTLLEGSTHWNAALPGPDNKSEAEDRGYIRALVARIGAAYPHDAGRVVATGYSNGGMMSAALACYESDLVAAIGIVSGAQLDTDETCAPSHPTPVITLHGTLDGVLPYSGGSDLPSAQSALDFWVAYNQTDPAPAVEEGRAGAMMVEHSTWSGGADGASVEHYRYQGGSHVWFEATYEGRDASALVWDFLLGPED